MDRHFHSEDALADDGLLFLEEPIIEVSLSSAPHWVEKFYDMNKYDWNDPDFVRQNRGDNAFLPVPLTQGFFMIVPKRMHTRLTKYPDGTPKKWTVKIDLNKQTGKIIKVYGRRQGRGDEPETVYISREIMGVMHGRGDVDHVNGRSLDNRLSSEGNLAYISVRQNMSKAFRTRKVNHDLQRGVELRGKNRRGEQMYGGTLRIRRGAKVKAVRSKVRWASQERAHTWYLNQLKKRFKRVNWAFNSVSVTYPTFPPLMESERDLPKISAHHHIDNSIADLVATF